MKPGGLLLTLGSLALWAPLLLLGAPLKTKGRCLLKCQRDEDCPAGHTCASHRGRQLCRPIAAVAGVPGTPSPTHGSDTGMPRPSGAHPKDRVTSKTPLPGALLRDTQLTEHHPLPKGPLESGEGTGDTVLPKETAPVPSEKTVCKKKPRPEVSTAEAGPARESEGSPLLLDSEPDPGLGKASGGREEMPARETSRPPDCTRPSARPASTEEDPASDAGCLVREDATSGDKPTGGSVSASNIPPAKPPSGEKPAPNEDHVSNTGHTTHRKPVSSGKPESDGKPSSAPGNGTQATPTAGAKPASHPGLGAHREPAPHKKPESAGKPAAAEKPEPVEHTEKEEEEDSLTEDAEEEDDQDDEGEDGEPDLGGDSDAFDKELDYGLHQSPFNAYEYRDAWSEEDSDDPEEGLEGGPVEDAGGFGDGEPVFDVWGDRAAARGFRA